MVSTGHLPEAPGAPGAHCPGLHEFTLSYQNQHERLMSFLSPFKSLRPTGGLHPYQLSPELLFFSGEGGK